MAMDDGIKRRRRGPRGWIFRACLTGVAVGIGAIFPPAGASARRIPLKTALPRPVFSGTPRFIVSPNLEVVTGTLRAPFLVPEGTRNFAAGQPVRSSDPKPFIGTPAKVTDGDKEGGGNSFLELSEGRQWVQIDLGGMVAIHVILVWHYHGEARVYHDVVVQVAADPDFGPGTVTLFNNDHDNSSGLGVGSDKEYIDTFEGRLIPALGRRARFVRLYSNGNTTDDMNDYVEVEVWGTAAPNP